MTLGLAAALRFVNAHSEPPVAADATAEEIAGAIEGMQDAAGELAALLVPDTLVDRSTDVDVTVVTVTRQRVTEIGPQEAIQPEPTG